jgi:hypothetical protein
VASAERVLGRSVGLRLKNLGGGKRRDLVSLVMMGKGKGKAKKGGKVSVADAQMMSRDRALRYLRALTDPVHVSEATVLSLCVLTLQ